MKTPPHHLSPYDPKYVAADRAPRNRMTALQRDPYAKYDLWSRYHKAIAVPVYTDEQNEAWAAAIEALCEQYPLVGNNVKSRKKQSQRDKAVSFARNGAPDTAFAHAVYGNIPKAQLHAVATLIFEKPLR